MSRKRDTSNNQRFFRSGSLNDEFTSSSSDEETSSAMETKQRKQQTKRRSFTGPAKRLPAKGGRSSRMKLREWVIKEVNTKKYPNLEWVDSQHTLLKIPWTHASRNSFDVNSDCCLIRNYAIHTGIYREGTEPDPRRWKANFRCAMNSLDDVQEMKGMSKSRGNTACKVYKFLDNPIPTPEYVIKKNKEKKTVKKQRRSHADSISSVSSSSNSYDEYYEENIDVSETQTKAAKKEKLNKLIKQKVSKIKQDGETVKVNKANIFDRTVHCAQSAHAHRDSSSYSDSSEQSIEFDIVYNGQEIEVCSVEEVVSDEQIIAAEEELVKTEVEIHHIDKNSYQAAPPVNEQAVNSQTMYSSYQHPSSTSLYDFEPAVKSETESEMQTAYSTTHYESIPCAIPTFVQNDKDDSITGSCTDYESLAATENLSEILSEISNIDSNSDCRMADLSSSPNISSHSDFTDEDEMITLQLASLEEDYNDDTDGQFMQTQRVLNNDIDMVAYEASNARCIALPVHPDPRPLQAAF